MLKQKNEIAEILLVEDSPGDAELTIQALERGKVANRVNVVDDGEKAIKYLRQEGEYVDAIRPDLILLDINLPRKSGIEVLQEIKNDEHLKTIPVIILTTSNNSSDVLTAYKNYANCYITKPVNLVNFMDTISHLKGFWISIVTLPVK